MQSDRIHGNDTNPWNDISRVENPYQVVPQCNEMAIQNYLTAEVSRAP